MTNQDQQEQAESLPDSLNDADVAAGERKLIEDRLAKTAQIRAKGIDPYPARFDRTHTSVEATKLFKYAEVMASNGVGDDV